MKPVLYPLLCHPAVCAVEDSYVIAVPVRAKALVSVEINGETYYDAANGVRISDTRVHLIRVPQAALNAARAYRVVCRRAYLRLPFGCLHGEDVAAQYRFFPVEKTEDIRICHISDCHGIRRAAASSGRYFGDRLDLLILNGDIQDFSARVSQTLLPYKIASDIVGGEKPVLLSRGNHDLRGAAAEKLAALYPTANGSAYFYARVGCMWFVVLDCGEDKVDGHREYGGTAAFHPFRMAQTAYLEALADGGSYREKDVLYRFVVSHVPFNVRNREVMRDEAPFDIEDDLYARWCRALNEKIRPQLLFSGHFHEIYILPRGTVRTPDGQLAGTLRGADKTMFPDDARCTRGLACDTLVGGMPKGKRDYISANVCVCRGGCTVDFADREGNVLKTETSSFPEA